MAIALFCCAVTEAILMGGSLSRHAVMSRPPRSQPVRRDRREFGFAAILRRALLARGLAALSRRAVRTVVVQPARRHAGRRAVAGSLLRNAGSGEAIWKVMLRPSAGTPAWSSACCNCGWSRSSRVSVSGFSTVISTRGGSFGRAVDTHLHLAQFGRVKPHGQPLRAIRRMAHLHERRRELRGGRCGV